ncbi:MAG: hypothetical protein M3Y53_03120 [Thermoproteota archaeon]|nr:hypothetical protein [Thermoproteota archaeon]
MIQLSTTYSQNPYPIQLTKTWIYFSAYDHIIPLYRDDVKSVDRIIFPPGSPIPPTTDENPTIPNDES